MSKRALIILVVGILVVAFVFLYMEQQEELEVQAGLKKELATLQKTLAQPSPPRGVADIRAEIEAVEAEIKAAEARFPKTEESLDITERLVNLAKRSGLEVTALSTSTGKKKLNGVERPVISLDLELQGQMGSILGFIDKLKTELTATEIVLVGLKKAQTVKELDRGKVGVTIYCQRGS